MSLRSDNPLHVTSPAKAGRDKGARSFGETLTHFSFQHLNNRHRWTSQTDVNKRRRDPKHTQQQSTPDATKKNRNSLLLSIDIINFLVRIRHHDSFHVARDTPFGSHQSCRCLVQASGDEGSINLAMRVC